MGSDCKEQEMCQSGWWWWQGAKEEAGADMQVSPEGVVWLVGQ